MGGPETFWLTFTNAALGVMVALCFLGACALLVREWLAIRRRHRAEDAELDRDMREFFGGRPGPKR